METLSTGSQHTCYTQLFNRPDYFYITYFERVRRACLTHCRNDSDADDMAQDFVLNKVMTGGLILKYQDRINQEVANGKKATSFRKYLYRAILNFCIEQSRTRKRNVIQNHDPQMIGEYVAGGERNLDADSLYAMSILHRTLQGVKNHCRKKKKEMHWVIFEELVLAEYLTGRKPRNRGELRLQFFPGSRDNQKIDSALTTVKRIFQRIIEDSFEAEGEGSANGQELFDEWMGILKRSNASLHSALQAAYRVSSPVADSIIAKNSIDMFSSPRDESIGEDELSLLLSYRMDLPLTDWVSVDNLMDLIPSKSPFMPGQNDPEIRKLSMNVLMFPTHSEFQNLQKINVVELLKRIKNQSRKLANDQQSAIPEEIYTLFYTLTSVIAKYQYGKTIYSLKGSQIQANIKLYLDKQWVDDQIRYFFQQSLAEPDLWLD
jgi:hypothetical protein